jgi:cell division septal protein FtsQ
LINSTLREENSLRSLVKPEKTARNTQAGTLRKLRVIGAVAALLAVLGITLLVLWFVFRAPRF